MIDIYMVLAFVIGAVIAFFVTKSPKHDEQSSQELAQAVLRSVKFVDVQEVKSLENTTVYLGYDLIDNKFLGQAEDVKTLYRQIFSSNPKFEMLYVRTDPNSDELVAVERSYTESVAQ